MKIKTVGEILAEERLRHRLSIESLAEKTKIKPKYLQALENNQFEKLPAATFVRGYIKIYGQLFGFDHQPLIALLRRDFKESVKGQLVPREFIKPQFKKRRSWGPETFVIMGLAAVFLTLVTYVAIQWQMLNQPPDLKILYPAEDDLVAARVSVKGETEPDAVVTVNSQPVALQPDGSFETEVYLSREGVNTISIEAEDRRGKTTLVQRAVKVKF